MDHLALLEHSPEKDKYILSIWLKYTLFTDQSIKQSLQMEAWASQPPSPSLR